LAQTPKWSFDPEIDCGLLAPVALDLVLDSFSLVEGPKTSPLNSRNVDKHILAATATRLMNEAVAFGRPFQVSDFDRGSPDLAQQANPPTYQPGNVTATFILLSGFHHCRQSNERCVPPQPSHRERRPQIRSEASATDPLFPRPPEVSSAAANPPAAIFCGQVFGPAG
jgi:hypothetical protein